MVVVLLNRDHTSTLPMWFLLMPFVTQTTEGLEFPQGPLTVLLDTVA